MKKSGTQIPSLRPLSTLRPCRIRDGIRSSVTTAWPRAASVQASMIESTSASTRVTPGSTPIPTSVPAAIVSGRPIPSSRTGTANSLRSAVSEMRDASAKRTSVSVASASSLTGSPLTCRSIRPSTGPASSPAEVKKIAGVTTDRSNRPETAEKASSANATAATTQAPNSSPHFRVGVHEPRPLPNRLLAAHCDAQAFLGRDEVIGVVCVVAEVDLHPVDRTGEDAAFACVVVAHRGSAISSDICGLICGEDQRHGCLDAAFTGLVAVEIERDSAALRRAAAVIGELHPHLMRARRDRGVGLDLEALQAEQVVAVRRTATFCVQAPTGERAALGKDDAFGGRVANDDFRRDGMRLVLDVEDAVLAEAPHAAEQHLRVPFDELGTADELGIEPLDAPIVEREHVVFAGLFEPQFLQLRQLLRHLGGEIVRLAPVGGRVVQLPDVVRERWQGFEHPRHAVVRDGGPALVVDAAVAEHLEVLRLVTVGLGRPVERIRHAHALDRPLLDAVDDRRLR